MNILPRLLLITCTFLIFSCSGQTEKKSPPTDSLTNVLTKTLKGKSLEDAKEMLISQSEQLETVFNIMNLQIQISPVEPTGIQNKEGIIEGPLYKLTPPKIVEEGVIDMALNYELNQDIKSNGSYVSADLVYNYKLPESLKDLSDDAQDNVKSGAHFNVKKIFFHDKSVTEDTSLLLDIDHTYSISSRKPIDSITTQLTYECVTRFDKFTLDVQHPKQQIKDGDVQLKQLNNREASILINGKPDHILAVAGINAADQLIDHNNTNSNSLPSTAKIKILKEYNTILKTWIANIEAKKYNNINALITDMVKMTPKNLNLKEEQPANTTFSTYGFYQDITKVIVYYAAESKIITKDITLKNEEVIASGMLLAEGDKPFYYGIVDAAGNWIVKPDYKDLEALNSYFYKTLLFNKDNSKLTFFRLDVKNKKLISFDDIPLKQYVLGTPLTSKYITFTLTDKDGRSVNGGEKGLMDNEGHIILQAQNLDISIAGNYIYTSRTNANTVTYESGLYTLTGKPVLPVNPNTIYDDGGYIFVSTKGSEFEAGTVRYKLLDQNTGKSFLPESITAINNYWQDGLLLVTNGSQKYLIDKKGYRAKH